MAMETSTHKAKTGTMKPRVKNHPTEDRSAERSLLVRRAPPWDVRGPGGAPSSPVKNHPRKRED